MNKFGIKYSIPTVTILHASPLWVAEVAGRTAYDSFENSEHVGVKLFPVDNGMYFNHNPDIESSDILTSLAWVHHHHSVIELVDISFSIKGTSRGVLQEHARHRIQSLTVQSTRYTMSSVLNAYVASLCDVNPKSWFIANMYKNNILVVESPEYCALEYGQIWEKLQHQRISVGDVVFKELAIAKSSLPFLNGPYNAATLFTDLQSGKKKRNVGDSFKHIVTDNWKVDMVVKFNLRSLKNYLSLRASPGAYWQIDMLAQEMIKVLPSKYLDLIIKPNKKGTTDEQN